MKKFIISILILTHSISYSQDTFSIVAVDPETGEVGAAGATCLFGQFGGIVDIISSIVPGKGGVISQAYVCIPNINMANATTLMESGYSPSQIITWLNNNDYCNAGNYQYRQYGIVDFDDSGNVRTAGFTGNLADDQNYSQLMVAKLPADGSGTGDYVTGTNAGTIKYYDGSSYVNTSSGHTLAVPSTSFTTGSSLSLAGGNTAITVGAPDSDLGTYRTESV